MCYGQSVVVSCYYDSLINNGSIYSETNILVDNEVYRLDNSHMKNIDISAEDSSLVDGEVEISCTIVYADGSMEKSTEVVVKGTCKFRFNYINLSILNTNYSGVGTLY